MQIIHFRFSEAKVISKVPFRDYEHVFRSNWISISNNHAAWGLFSDRVGVSAPERSIEELEASILAKIK